MGARRVRHAAALSLPHRPRGVGFRPAQLAAERLERRSFGLLSVQERIEGVGGRVLIDSAPGSGTQVLLWIPCVLEDEREGDEQEGDERDDGPADE